MRGLASVLSDRGCKLAHAVVTQQYTCVPSERQRLIHRAIGFFLLCTCTLMDGSVSRLRASGPIGTERRLMPQIQQPVSNLPCLPATLSQGKQRDKRRDFSAQSSPLTLAIHDRLYHPVHLFSNLPVYRHQIRWHPIMQQMGSVHTTSGCPKLSTALKIVPCS